MPSSHNIVKMATSFSNADTEDNYLESTTESPQISSFDNSKRGRQEDESWNSQIEEEREISKKIKKNNFLWNWTDQCTILENLYEFAGTIQFRTKSTIHISLIIYFWFFFSICIIYIYVFFLIMIQEKMGVTQRS